MGKTGRLSALLIATGVLACATSERDTSRDSSHDAQPRSNRAAPPQAERLAIFDTVWTTIRDHYYDPSFNGVNWESVRKRYRPRAEHARSEVEFYSLFEEMVSQLRDAHTVFVPPRSEATAERVGIGSVGITLAHIDSLTLVATVDSASDAFHSGVWPGMVLRAVNDKPVPQLFDESRTHFAGSSSDRAMRGVMHAALLYGGFLGPTRNFGIDDFSGRRIQFTVRHRRLSTAANVAARRLRSGYGYISFHEWNLPIAEQFRSELWNMADVAALIIDLRGNGGGTTESLLHIASNFVPPGTCYGGMRTREGGIDRYSTRTLGKIFHKPVVILVDETSASASESFSAFMQEIGRAVIIGNKTCGCTLNQRVKPIRGGSALRWSYRAYVTPAGRELEGDGITPDLTVRITREDLRLGRDPVIIAAEKALSGVRVGLRSEGPVRGWQILRNARTR
ncbi:MAG TPA: S41 family peptidase [Gemmatimonadaceae bacterium]|nr:S41 family peptidase [Gemmatimonadaceae bacterium]